MTAEKRRWTTSQVITILSLPGVQNANIDPDNPTQIKATADQLLNWRQRLIDYNNSAPPAVGISFSFRLCVVEAPNSASSSLRLFIDGGIADPLLTDEQLDNLIATLEPMYSVFPSIRFYLEGQHTWTQ